MRRVHIPKGDGRTRPLGITALEDKIVQQAVKMILEQIYEPAFLGFSYGFRCQFARRRDHLSGVFCTLMGPPDLQGHGTTRRGSML